MNNKAQREQGPVIKKAASVLVCAAWLALPSQARAELSDLGTLGACVELQTAGLVLQDEPTHVHAAFHPGPTLDSLETYFSALSSGSSSEKAFQQEEVRKGRDAVREQALAEMPSDSTCAKALIEVHRAYCTEAPEQGGFRGIWIPIGKSCDPMDLLNSSAEHHPNEQLLRSALGLESAPED